MNDYELCANIGGERSDSPAMVKHAMEVMITVTQYLTPGQWCGVMWCDEPLYALAKHIQWAFPNYVG